jgi:hypothetical protein
MSKFSIFSVLLIGSLLVAPVATANNYSVNKTARASDVQSSSSLITDSLSSFSDSINSQSLFSSSLISSSSSSSLIQSDSFSSVTKRTKVITDVKPVKLNVQTANWWKETDAVSGGNSSDLGNDAINTQIQSKLQTQCPNIYDSINKTINETNLANCAPINNLPFQKIAVIDSGVTPNAEMMPFMDQANSWNFFTSVNYPSICTASSPLNFYTLVQGNSSTYYCKEKGTQTDTDYHGTVVALSAIRNYEKSLLKNKIKITPYSLRALDTINISEAIDEVVRAGDIKTINLSIGTPYNLAYVEDSVNLANSSSINLYASSGNCAIYSAANCDYNGNAVQDIPEEANNAPDYPASYLNSVMVGSSNYSDNSILGIIRATYSNFVTTLRSNFVTAPVGNTGIILPCFVNCQGATSYSYLGTSFAAPQAAAFDGIVAKYSELMKLNLGQPNEKVLVATDTPKQYVTTNTTDILDVGNDLQTGSGLINLRKISDKIVVQLQTLNVPASSSSVVVSSSSLLASSSTTVPSSSVAASSSVLALSANIPGNIRLSSDNLNYIVDFTTTNFIPTPGSNHVHFYYDTEVNTVLNKMYSSPAPYNLAISTKPAGATQLCIIVANSAHQIIPNSGVCKPLPTIQAPASSSSILASSSNVLSSSSNQAASASSSSVQATPASSSQISPSSQVISSPVSQNSSSVISQSSQSVVVSSSSRSSSAVSSQSSSVANSGGGVISIVSGIISNIINTITGASANLNGNKNTVTSSSSVATPNPQDKIAIKEQGVKASEFAIKEQGVKAAEDIAFAGLVNNTNGFTNSNEYGIKEQGIKASIVDIETQSGISNDSISDTEKGIKDNGTKSCGNCGLTGGRLLENTSSTSSSQVCEVLNTDWVVTMPTKNFKSKTSVGDGCVNSNPECRKGWDGSIKGVTGDKIIIFRDDGTAGDKIPGDKRVIATQSSSICNPIDANSQSGISSTSDLGKYITIALIAIVGILGALVINGFTWKLGLQSIAGRAINTKGMGSNIGKVASYWGGATSDGRPDLVARAINTKGAGSNIGISENPDVSSAGLNGLPPGEPVIKR